MFPVESFQATLNKSVTIFQQHQIRYHLTGGITSIFYGEPRMTQDVDMVIDNDQVSATLDAFLTSLDASDFVYDSDAIRNAVKNRGLFQLLDGVESLKLDIYPRELIPGELDRSVTAEVFASERFLIASRADAAISKLVWINKGSHKSRRDLRRIYRTASEADREIMKGLAHQLHLTSLLEEVLNEVDEIE